MSQLFSDVLDEPTVADDQASFRGGMVSNKPARDLRQDEAAELINCDITLDGNIVTRPGIERLGAGNAGGGSLKGLTYYDTPTQSRLIAFTNTGAYWWNSPNWTLLDAALPIGVGGGFATNVVSAAQGINRLYMADGTNNIWSWDGAAVADLGSAGANQPPAAAKYVVWHTNRVCAAGMASERDAIYFSQFLDGATWDKTNWQIRVGAGEDDYIVGLVPWINFNLVVLKRRSIWLVNCNPETAVSDFQIKLVHRRIGCVNGRTAVQVGSDVFFLSDTGVRSLRHTLATEEQSEVGPPLSEPISNLMRRIATDSVLVGLHSAAFINDRYILAVRLNLSTEAPQNGQYCFVYNTLTDSWSGWWEGIEPYYFSYRQPSGSTPRLSFAGQNEVFDFLDGIAPSGVAAYTNNGTNYRTVARWRAFEFGDRRSKKTGLNAEVEFYDCETTTATLSRRIDGSTSDTAITTLASQTNGAGLPAAEVRRRADLMALGQFRDLQLIVSSTGGKLGLRSGTANAFIDSFDFQ